MPLCDDGHSPAEWQEAYRAGDIPPEVAESYVQLASSVSGPLLAFPGFRDRLVADPSFIVKVSEQQYEGIEEAVTESINRAPFTMTLYTTRRHLDT